MLRLGINGINELSKDDKEIYGFARLDSTDKSIITLSLYGAQTKKELLEIPCDKISFLEQFIPVFKNSKLKAIIFHVFSSQEDIYFVKASSIHVGFTGIPYMYFAGEEYMRAAILAAADLSLKVGERYVEVLIDANGFVVSEMEYTEQGYFEREQRDCKPYKKMKPELIRQQILGPNNPAKIVFHANSPGMKSTKFLMKKVLNNVDPSKVLLIEGELGKYNEKLVFETVKWMFDNDYTRFYVCLLSFRNYMIRFKYCGKFYPLILCKKGEAVPFKQEVVVSKSYLPFFLTTTDKDLLRDDPLEIPKDIHALKISLKVDVNNFLHPKVEGIICDKVETLPAQLDAENYNIPVIGFYGELSFMYAKDDAGYKLLDCWNGKLGKDIYISFDEKKPKFFENAVKAYVSDVGKCVVHDLIKIMSTSPENLSSIQTFGYSLSRNPGSVLVNMKNHCGERKAATPAFLMAMLLKEHLKELAAQAGGVKPSKIGFCLFDDFDNDPEAKERVEAGLKESCQMLKNLECCFIEAV